MRELSKWISKLDSAASIHEGMLEYSFIIIGDTLSEICGIILSDLKKYPVIGFFAILIHALIVISYFKMWSLSFVKKRPSIDIELYHTNRLRILREAGKKDVGKTDATKSSPNSIKAYGIATMPKTRIHQWTVHILNAIALALSILLLFSSVIIFPSFFTNTVKAPFSYRCCIFFSSFIALMSTILQKNVYSKNIKSLSPVTSKYYDCLECAEKLNLASFVYLVVTYQFPNILGLPTFLLYANVYFALYKFVFDFRYFYNRNILDRTTKAIVMNTSIKVADAEEAEEGQQSKKMSQIIVLGKASEWIDELKKRYSTLKSLLQLNRSDNYGRLDCGHRLSMFVTQMLITKYAIKYIDTYQKGTEHDHIEIRIHPSSIKDTEDIAASLHKFDGTVTIIYGDTTNIDTSIRNVAIKSIQKFEGDEFKMSNQYLINKHGQLEESFYELIPCDHDNIIKEHNGSMVLTDFFANVIAAQGAVDVDNEEVAVMTNGIISEDEYITVPPLKSILQSIEPKFKCIIMSYDSSQPATNGIV